MSCAMNAHSLFWYIGHHTTKAVYKCTISRYVESRKYGPYRGTYTNIAKTAIASLYFQCNNPISYSGHPRGSKKYRLAKMWGGGGARGSYLAHGLYRKENKPLYIAFIDLKQAFDTIRHQDLFYKPLKSGIANTFYNIIKSIYDNTTLVVQSCDGTAITQSFISHMGIRQGDNLSPTLFNMFVNDIPNIFNEFCDSVEIGNLHINCMMYADDLLILSETNSGLQHAMDELSKYCNEWGMAINTNKTKFMVAKGNRQLV